VGLKGLVKKIKNESKEKSFEMRYLEAIDKYLVEPKGEQKKVRLAFRPSSYYKCQRMVYYFLNGVPEKNKKPARIQRILDIGTITHEWIQEDVLMNMCTVKPLSVEEIPTYGEIGIEFIREHGSAPIEIKFVDKRWTARYPVSAMVDGFLEFENMNFLFEFKTINPKDFETLIEPLMEHIKQGAIYALCTGVRQVMFHYINKGNQEWKAFLVKYTDEQLEWVIERIQTIEGYVMKNELPEKEVSTKDCRYCSFKNMCGKEINPEVKHEN